MRYSSIFLPYPPYEPDVAFSGVPVLSQADGVYPAAHGLYIPAKGLDATASGAGITSTAGAVLIKTGDTTYRVYAHKVSAGTHSIRSFDSASFGAAYTGTEVG